MTRVGRGRPASCPVRSPRARPASAAASRAAEVAPRPSRLRGPSASPSCFPGPQRQQRRRGRCKLPACGAPRGPAGPPPALLMPSFLSPCSNAPLSRASKTNAVSTRSSAVRHPSPAAPARPPVLHAPSASFAACCYGKSIAEARLPSGHRGPLLR